ncbi:NAD-dependent epimerase/dehydratase family protein [Planctomicrobium sp. SH661]|uniref:NAD-dependent epimerase/dehydratase family protein n=1 Tax=Planctomicrobium sp. SH661 TaxID=3448124 RepID=UPI003F5C2940
MPVAIITGSAGLIGSESVRFLTGKGYQVVGIDNDMRKEFFGEEASTAWSRKELEKSYDTYTHRAVDIRDVQGLEPIFSEYGSDIELIIHTAAQPSHDWAAKAPFVDFSVNANGTLNLLEMTRLHAPKATFIFTSTNKVYGDTPNRLPLVEKETRWEIDASHPYYEYGIDENMSIDQSKHSLFGASKVAADILVQEYGRYFDMHTAIFRGGCLTGPGHSGTALHGFLSYLVKCALTGTHYTVLGYKGKQVRDNIHSYDLVNMFWHFHQNPRCGEVYNAGGSRHSHCSMQEAIAIAEEVVGRKMNASYTDEARSGDHIWYVSDVRKFQAHYPEWSYRYGIRDIIEQIAESMSRRTA